MLNYLPFLFFAVLMVTMGVICRRYLQRVKAAYAKHGLTMPDLRAPRPGGDRGGPWFVYQAQPNDPPELAEEMRLIIKETYRTVRPLVTIGMALVLGTAMYASWIGKKC